MKTNMVAICYMMLSTFLTSLQIVACTAEPIIPGTDIIPFKEAERRLKNAYPGIKLELCGICISCGSKYYSIKNEEDRFLSKINVGKDSYQGNRLLILADAVLGTPPQQIASIIESRARLYEDIEKLTTEFGVQVYDLECFSSGIRFSNKSKQRFFVSMRHIDEDGGQNIIKVLLLNPAEFIPGKASYDLTKIYCSGDLRDAFISDEVLFKTYKNLVWSPQKNKLQYVRLNWDLIVRKWQNLGFESTDHESS
jgi:hypothetical protein